MHILFTDETNLPADPKASFFAYGGLIVPPGQMGPLHDGIAAIRKAANYNPTDELKFQTAARPAHISISDCTKAKNDVVELCISLECKFIVYVVLHAIAKKTPVNDLVAWGANHVIGKYNHYLHKVAADGIVAVDRLPGAAEYGVLTDRFSKGLTFPDAAPVVLDRIKLFASTCINASHAASAMDIVLGSFRYCINEPKNVPAAKEMMTKLSKLIWCEQVADVMYPFERGLILRPKDIKVASYQQKYDDLIAWINELLEDEVSDGAV